VGQSGVRDEHQQQVELRRSRLGRGRQLADQPSFRPGLCELGGVLQHLRRQWHVKLYVAHSDDEGRTWSAAVQVSAVASNSAQGFRETGQMTVSSTGTVEAFWTENADSKKVPSLQVAAVSTDGGQTFSAPITIAQVTDYPLTGTPFDVVDLFNRVPGMSARVDCYPHPTTNPSSARVYVVWCDFSNGHGTVRGAVSSDGVH